MGDSETNSNKPQQPSSRRVQRVVWLAIALAVWFAAYAVVGFFLVPKGIEYAATKFVRDQYGRELGIARVRANPFLYTLEVEGLDFPDRDNQSMLRADLLSMDFEAWRSLWERAFVFKHVHIVRPGLHAVARQDGKFNLEDLVLPEDPEDKNEDSWPSLWVQSFKIEQGSLDYLDLARRGSFKQGIKPFSFILKDFRTTPRGGDFKLTAQGEEGGAFAWEGKLALSPRIESVGAFAIRDLKVTSVAAYLGDALPFAMPKGTVEVSARYRMRLADRPQAEVSLDEVAVLNTSLRARTEQQEWVEIPAVRIQRAHLIVEKKRLDIEHVLLDRIHVDARLEADRSLNLERLFKTGADLGAAPKTLEPVKRAVAQPDWDVRIARAQLKNAEVDFEDAAIAPGTRFKLERADAELRDLSMDLTKPVSVSFQAHLDNEAGTLQANGTLRPAPFAAKLEVEVKGLQLALFQPYVAPYAALTIQSGSFGTQGTLTLDSALGFVGHAALTDVATTDNAQHKDLFRVQKLEARKLVFQQAPDTLSIERIVVDKAFAKLVLSEQLEFNLTEVFAPQVADQKPKAEHKSRAPAAASTEAKTSESMAIRVGSVVFQNMRLNFSDFNVQPNFSADIRALSGRMSGISSDPRSRANLKLKGHLGDTSPVVITATSQPFEFERFTDIRLESDNIALPVFNPYSGRFAGYNITRGELSTAIHYVINRKKLEASHHVRISQLTWGEKTDSKEAAPLPVKLATVLLRDRDGVISLDVPVKGTLDDPKFKVGPIIRQVLKNIIVKAATSPFDLLGSLFKGAEKARYVRFAPGTAELDADAKEGLAALGKALREKPELKLDIPVGVVEGVDREALRARKFESSLQRSVEDSLSSREKRDGVPEYASLTPEQKLEALEKLHKRLTGENAKLAKAPKPQEGTPRKSAKVMQKTYQADKLAAEVQQKIPVEKPDLDALGQRRGEAIEAELNRSSQIDTGRIFLSNQGKIRDKDGKIELELDVK